MQYTSEELAIRLWDTERIRHTMNRMCYYLSNRDFRGLINDLWVQKNKRTASLGYNNGYYIGMDEIVRHLVLEQTDLPKTGSACMETLPPPSSSSTVTEKLPSIRVICPGSDPPLRQTEPWRPT